MQIVQLARSPRLYQIDGFAGDDELGAISTLAGDETRAELPIAGEPLLETLRERLRDVMQLENDFAVSFRFRRRGVGERQPRRRDVNAVADRRLVATALLYVSEPEAGGGTSFPSASPEPLTVQPRRGRLVLWLNHRADGSEDPAAEHEPLPVAAGEKLTLTSFIYARIDRAAPSITPGELTRPTRTVTGFKLHCIDRGVPESTTRVLRSACRRRGVEYVSIAPDEFDFSARAPLGDGDLLYRASTSLAAIRVEQFLVSPAATTFYSNPLSLFYDCLTPPLVLQRAGVPIPRTIFVPTTDRALMQRYVEWLGGFPVVLKWLGRSSGIGVVRVDSLPSLYSIMDHAVAGGACPLLCRYVADAVHHRVVVIGDRAVAHYRNAQIADDFRSYGSDDVADYLQPLDGAMADLAVRAARALQVEMAGVDILRAPDGELFVLEANFPCYFAQAQLAVGVDVAGMMVDYLLAKARRNAPAGEGGQAGS